jgi:hypothetical protein
LWKQNVKAMAGNNGEEYVSASGIVVKPKLLKALCENYRFEFSSKLNVE